MENETPVISINRNGYRNVDFNSAQTIQRT